MSSILSSFTDVLDDVIDDSQPISVSPDDYVQNTNVERNPACEEITAQKPTKGTGQYGQFRSTEEIDPKYRGVFTYPYFNLVQSKVIEDALYSDKSMVVCAPTGSGKTVVFEMAIVQLLMEMEKNRDIEDYKIIYMAPVKALCTERLTEWYSKFTRLGLTCIEVTGDTDVDFSQLKLYRIIITTPEKWDMLTRRWRDHRGLVEMIKLFLIDEVHILNDVTRGPVLEAVVSRMKTIESAAQSAYRIEQIQSEYQGTEVSTKMAPPKIRFVAVSATVSNPDDVASWLGTTERPAVIYKFGDECRPVKLKRVVEGYPCQDGMSIFKFDIILNYKLWPIIQKYHNGKPTLIFCNTRKSVILTAETLSRELTVNFDPQQKAKLMALASSIKNKKLQMLLLNGVGCHHAGLLFEERQNIEQAFRNRDLPILITTTTLAMGVNLPAHLVIIKNTQQYVNGAYQEYSMSTILQMVGRAGRPQYDTEATAVIMTTLKDKPRYQALVGGSEPLQSYLHKRLPENLNSEAALGTVGDVAQCVEWLRSTFLYVRAGRDPKRYLGLSPTAPQQLISKKIEELCVKAMNGLASSGMITMDEACCIQSTEAGRLMSVYYLDLETMKQIMKIDGSETLEQLLWIVCQCHELSDMHLRMDERRLLNTLNRNRNATTIRFPMKGKINTRQMKLNCLIQSVLGCLPISDPSLNQEAMKIMRIVDRICKCLVAYVTNPELIPIFSKCYSAVLNALILAKCVSAQLWENSPYVSKQLKGIGPTFSNLLASAGKVNFMLLEESHPRDLERIINKGPPTGNVLHKLFTLLPKYQLTVTPIDENRVAIQLLLLNQTHLAENLDNLTAGSSHKCHIVVGDSENDLIMLNSFKDTELISIYDGSITYQITRKHNFEHKIFVNCISTSFVGIDVNCEYLFKALEPTPISSYQNLCNDRSKTVTKRQTTITETFRERKRKNNDEGTQSKEKIKRSNAIMDKFHNLKQSFGKTSKQLKEDLDKTARMSNEILTAYMAPTSTESTADMWNDDKGSETIPRKIVNDSTLIDMDVEEISSDNLEDENIDYILKKIENEMSKSTTSERTRTNTAITKSNDSKCNDYKKKYHSSKKHTSSFNGHLGKVIRKSNTKSNYNFIDLLERNIDLTEEEESVALNDNTSFTNTIKSEIEKYLSYSHRVTRTSDKIIEELLTEPLKAELPNVFLQSPDKRRNEIESTINNTEETNIEENNEPTVDSVLQNDLGDVLPKTDINGLTDITYRSVLDDTKDTKIYIQNNQDKTHDSLDIASIPNNSNISVPVIRAWSLTKEVPADLELSIKHDNTNNPGIKSIEDLAPNTDNEKALILYRSNTTFLRNTVLLHKDLPYSLLSTIENINIAFKGPINNQIAVPYEGIQISTPNISAIGLISTKSHSIKPETLNAEKSKYSCSTTNVEHSTKEMPDRFVSITRKLRLDLDVTEITSKNSQEIEHMNVENEVNWKDSKQDKNLHNRQLVNINCIDVPKKSNNIQDEICLEQDKVLKICDKQETVEQSAIQESKEFSNKSIKINKTTENTVAQILQKYYNYSIRKKSKAVINNRPQMKINDCAKPTFMKMNVPKRPFKINQIDNIRVILPDSLIEPSNSEETITNDSLQHEVLQRVQNMMDVKTPPTALPPIDLPDKGSPDCIPSIALEIEPEDLQIDHKLFDPQILLQSFNTDNDDFLIPPPPEFSNEADFGRAEQTNFQEFNAFELQGYIDTEVTSNDPRSSAPLKAETWTLSRDDSRLDERFSLNYRPFTINHKYSSGNTILPSSAPVSRRQKLEQFSFSQKAKLKK